MISSSETSNNRYYSSNFSPLLKLFLEEQTNPAKIEKTPLYIFVSNIPYKDYPKYGTTLISSLQPFFANQKNNLIKSPFVVRPFILTQPISSTASSEKTIKINAFDSQDEIDIWIANILPPVSELGRVIEDQTSFFKASPDNFKHSLKLVEPFNKTLKSFESKVSDYIRNFRSTVPTQIKPIARPRVLKELIEAILKDIFKDEKNISFEVREVNTVSKASVKLPIDENVLEKYTLCVGDTIESIKEARS